MRQRAEVRRQEEGYTQHHLDRLARYSPEAIAWRVAVFTRDDYTCQECSTRGGRLEADHIKPFAYFLDLRFDISNGRTLCRKCHDATKVSALRMRQIWQGSTEVGRYEVAPIGQEYGDWTVLAFASIAGGITRWRCRCRCGKEHNVLARSLVNGESMSCRPCIPRDALGRIMKRAA